MKLTGKGSGWTYGVLTAATAREYAQVEASLAVVDESSGTARVERLIEPAAAYAVGRVQRDVRNGTSSVGGLVTAVVRERLADAFTGGFDYALRWDRNRTRWDGHWVLTRAPGAGGVRTSGGGETNVSVSRKHVNASAHYDHFGRHFRVADLGFFRTRPNRHQASGALQVGNPDPWRALRSVWAGAGVSQGWTNERLVFERQGNVSLQVQFRNFWQTSGSLFQTFRTLDDLDTRGGPPIVAPAYRVVSWSLAGDPRRRWRWRVTTYRGATPAGGWFSHVSTGVSARASDRLEASATASYDWGRDIAQWIANVDADGDGAIDHVYGTLRRDVVDVTFRGTYAFGRDLTLQGFLQPFVAAGRFGDIGRLARPRSFAFEPVALPFDPGFHRMSLRGNAVLRWEYRPGSTLFVVWDLSRADASRPGVFRPWRDLRGTFRGDGSHVLMVKASYWLNR